MKKFRLATQAGAAIAFALMTSNAFALGGLDTANSTAADVRTGVYALVGTLAGVYLLYLGIMAKTERKSWADFGWGVVHVAAVGGSLALATWAWSLFA